jgi:hypothetical protein
MTKDFANLYRVEMRPIGILRLVRNENSLLLLALLVSIFGICFSIRSVGFGSKIETQYFPPPKQLVHFTFGYRAAGADALWLRAIQDFDYCDKKVSEKECVAKGWLFQVIDLATDLDPSFVMPHSYGALSLSVLASDSVGSAVIFEKGVRRFPKSWTLSYWAGYHALLEENDPGKAAKYLENAAKNGAPQWVYSLASRLYTDAGKKELALGLIHELESNGFDEKLLKRMKAKLSQKK